MSSPRSDVLLSWVARKNDPFDQDGKAGQTPRYGPTLMLLLDPASPYRDRIGTVVLLHRAGAKDQEEHQKLLSLKQIIKKERPHITIESHSWRGDDSTDHRAIFAFLRERLPAIRDTYRDRELVIHLSPGSPAMQTVWLLMVETGMIPEPVTLVQSYREEDRHGRPLAAQVKLDLESFYKAYLGSRAATAPGDQQPLWDPRRVKSKRLRAVFAEAERFARLRVPVLILGERGTGKTELASWIRANSPFRVPTLDGDWPAVACGQYSPETLRGELFGYRRGAFTGADQEHKGLIEKADNDTLFLDELGDISRDLQRLLIKAVEEGRFQRLGETSFRESRFRLLSATNKPIDQLRQTVDADFFDRVSYLSLTLPPLRELSDEIPWLWQRIYALAQARAASSGPPLSEADHRQVITTMQDHPLPGNLRDLYGVAYRLLAAPTEGSAVAYACQDMSPRVAPLPLSQAVAQAFATGQPLEETLPAHAPLSMDQLEGDLHAYLAAELSRIARARGVPVESLCDRSARALRLWKQRQDPAAQSASDGRKTRRTPRDRPRPP